LTTFSLDPKRAATMKNSQTANKKLNTTPIFSSWRIDRLANSLTDLVSFFFFFLCFNQMAKTFSRTNL